MTPTKAPPEPSLPIAKASPHPWVILVVDDEPDIARSLKKLLEQSIPGSEILTSNSGTQALTMLDRVDLIIADYRMPGMDGMGFLAQCLRLRPEAKRILLTAFPGPVPDLQLQANYKAEAAFVWKGLGPEALVAAVRKVMVASTPLASRAIAGT